MATQSLRRRIIYALRLLAVAAALLAPGIPFALGYSMMISFTAGGCGGGDDPRRYDLPFEEVAFPAAVLQTTIRGYFIPGGNGVTVIVPPTGASDRGNWMHEIAVLHRHGYSALTYESRNCLGYAHSLGYAEVAEVADALAYLRTRPDVNMERVAIHGFSTAGATAILAAARFPELRAVVAEGGYHDFAAQLRASLGGAWYSLPYMWGAQLAYRLITGHDMGVLSPVSVIRQIAPRPVLLIYGTAEPSLDGGRAQLAAAGAHASLWEVPGAAHGGYWYAAPDEFERRVIAFYDGAFAIR